ncbi:DUF3883 domain-containing protein [Ruegeria pomeroyi]|nr:DUF3883 domain-containing protein [Ruegeria pomeroyi]
MEPNKKVASSERDFVEALASRKIQGFVRTIGDDGEYLDPIYQISASLTKNVASDYYDRFLIELIQNAYDAHPVETRDGRIEIVLDLRHGAEGTLFVANTGHAFSDGNVGDLCNIGLSRKPLGESIGNKGLGFRSVVQVTDAPKIYSQGQVNEEPLQFSGYCFRFAAEDDYAELIDDPHHYEFACRDLPLFHIPVWLEKQSDEVVAFAADGFSTLVELPLRDLMAQEAVRREIKELQRQKAPMLLFLDRVKSLAFRILDEAGEVETKFVFERSEETKKLPEISLSRVELGDIGIFLVARRAVAEAKMQAAIAEAISSKQINDHWMDWNGEGDVAIAIRLDAPVEEPRLYTYLPMGEQANAPFAGYLHGSFFPSSNRKDLNARNRLNAVLLEESTTLAAGAIHHIVTDPNAQIADWLSVEERASAVVDILCWEDVGSLETDDNLGDEIAKKVAAEFDSGDLDNAAIVPCIDPSSAENGLAWKPSRCSRMWPTEDGMFSASAAAYFSKELDIWPIWVGVGSRLERLNDFLLKHTECYCGFPRGTERAKFVARAAAKLHKDGLSSGGHWRDFYAHLPDFMSDQGAALAGLPVLLGDDGELHQAMLPTTQAGGTSGKSRQRRAIKTAIFSSPDRRRTEIDDDLDVDPPKSLSQRFGFLTSELPWHEDLAVARKYLVENRLVAEFDREAVLAQLSRTLRDVRNQEVLRVGLRWAFQLWLQPRASGRPFRLQPQHRFRVPALDGGYIEAQGAVFSAGWPDETLGQLLQDFLDAAPPDIPDLQELAGRRLAGPDHPAFRGKQINEWVVFLSELHVARGLEHQRKTSKRTSFKAHEISEFSFLENYDIPESFKSLWREDIEELDSSLLSLPYQTGYVIAGELNWLPGQADVDSFSAKCGTLYAKLVFHWLERVPNLSWEFEIHHSTYWNADRRNWPTPLQVFLRSARWLPVDDRSHSNRELIAATPSDIWLNDGDGERFLPYLPKPVLALRAMFERANTDLIRTLTMRAGIRILNNSNTLVDQLAYLASRFAMLDVDDYFKPRLLNLYYATWEKFFDYLEEDSSSELEDTFVPVEILVQRHQSVEIVNMFGEEGPEHEIVYVCDVDRESDAGLLAASGRLFFQLRGGDPGATGKLFEYFYSERVRRMSQVDYSLLADRKPIDEVEKTPVPEVCPPLRTMLAVAIEALTGTEMQRLPADRSELLAKLDRISLAKAKNVSFFIDGMSIPPDQMTTQAIPYSLSGGQSVILVAGSSEWSWDLVDRCLPAICEVLGQRALAPNLRLLLAHISRDEPIERTPSMSIGQVGRLAALLQLPGTAANAALATLSAGLERQVPYIQAVLHYFCGTDVAVAFADGQEESLRDPGLLLDTISNLLSDASVSAEELLSIARSALGPADFREGLGLDFLGFNTSLKAMGLEPETYPELHRRSLENFIREHELDITDCLRVSYSKQLTAMEPAEGYGAIRDSLRNIEADSDWLLLYKEPPATVLEKAINGWLAKNGAPSLLEKDWDLPPIVEVREHNRKFVSDFGRRAIPVLRVWCANHPSDRRPEILSQADGIDTLRKMLDDIGVLDFQMLDDRSLAEWLRVLDVWPASMPLSLELSALGLSEDDLNEDNVKTKEDRETKLREARMVAFNGNVLDPREVDLLALAEELKQALPTKLLSARFGLVAELAEVKNQKGDNNQGHRDRGGRKGRNPRAPEEKTELIGQLGELVVYHWLRKIFPKQDIDSAWRSKNGSLITGREGDDGLGFDFEVSYGNQTWQIEVKASSDDPRAFELGETEVRAARLAAQPRNGMQYRIVYVSYVTDPDQTAVEMLPNPLTEDGERLFTLLGEGIRYGFPKKKS